MRCGWKDVARLLLAGGAEVDLSSDFADIDLAVSLYTLYRCVCMCFCIECVLLYRVCAFCIECVLFVSSVCFLYRVCAYVLGIISLCYEAIASVFILRNVIVCEVSSYYALENFTIIAFDFCNYLPIS